MSIAEGYGSIFQLQEQIKLQRSEITRLHQRVQEYESRIIGVGEIAINSVSREKYDAVCNELATLRQAQKWQLVRDGESLAMLQSPDGRIFRLQQLGKGDQWGNADDNDELIAMLAPTIPEGWVMVPVKATYEMREAGRLATQREGIETTTWLRKTIYDAMLAAAPKPEDK